jgi:hypothetical protein
MLGLTSRLVVSSTHFDSTIPVVSADRSRRLRGARVTDAYIFFCFLKLKSLSLDMIRWLVT